MFNSFSEIFNFQSTPTNRKYQPKPKLPTRSNIIERKKFNSNKRNMGIFQGILDFLPTPIQNWALQYQKSLYNFALHQWVYNEIISFSTSFKQKQSACAQQTSLIQQLITQVRMQHELSAPNFKKPRVSLHNIFVLMTQYKVMQEIIHDLNTEELEMMVDGLSYVYFHGVGKVENVGEVLSEEQIAHGVGGWGTIDQLTCCIHFITTHTKLYKTYPQKANYSLMKEIQILQMPFFIKVYDCLHQNKKIDNIVNSIPMFMEFLQIFVKHKNNSLPGCEFVINVKWLSGLGYRVMQIIQYNINKLLLLNNQLEQEFSPQDLAIIQQLETVNEQNEKEQSQIVHKLTQKAMLLKQTQGHINPRILFSFAYHHLYTVNFMLKLTKKVLELAKCHYQVYKETCEKVCKFLLRLFECAHKFQFMLPENSIGEICQIIKIISNEGEYLFGLEEREVRGYDFLYGKEIDSKELKEFAKNLQKSQRFGCYHNHKPRPRISSNSQMLDQEIAEDYNVMLQFNEDSIFSFLLSSIYTMKIDYLAIIYTILKNCDRRYLSLLQFYFIKNELLHFLLENEHEVQLKDKKNIKLMYNTIGYLLKGNYVSYAIVDEIIGFDEDQKTRKSGFVQDLKKNFPETKELLLIVLADNITVNCKFPESYSYCPIMLQKLLYPSQEQLKKDPNASTKHEVWISYIFNVILHELFTVKKRFEEIESKKRKIEVHKYQSLIDNLIIVEPNSPKQQFQHQIYDWITMILFLHIDYTQQRRDSQGTQDQLILFKFVMTYLTTILSQAIKWKYKNETQRMVDFLKTLQDWENHYTDLILNQENNEDLLEKEYGGAIKFLFLKRWNKKIVKAIGMYLESIDQYDRERRQSKRRSLEKVRSLKNIGV